MLNRTKAGGFTLVELLVVVSIIALLLGILIPSLQKARAAAMTTRCLGHTRTIALVMQMYADSDPSNFYPTARMPKTDTSQPTWMDLTRPFVEKLDVYRCPTDKSTLWDDPNTPREVSYGINAYFTPNHPPYWGVTPAQVRNPSETVIGAELIESTYGDHFMPMYWGDPPTVANMMMQDRQWHDPDGDGRGEPKTIIHTRHRGEANYVFTDGHAGTHAFTETWVQNTGGPPILDWYNPRR